MAQEHQAAVVSLQSQSVAFVRGIYRSVVLCLTTSMRLFSVDDIDRSVSVTNGVYLPWG